jgi:hypothetical protein
LAAIWRVFPWSRGNKGVEFLYKSRHECRLRVPAVLRRSTNREPLGRKVPEICKQVHSTTVELLSYPVKEMQFTKDLQEIGQLAADLQKSIELER